MTTALALMFLSFLGVSTAWVLPLPGASCLSSCHSWPARRIHHGSQLIIQLPMTTEVSGSEESLDVEALMEMDCFVYSRKDSDGSKLELGVMEEDALQPICAWTMEEAFDDYIEFVVDEEDRYSVKFEDVKINSLIPADSLSYGSRQVGGGKGPGNPHGEESELLYYIRREALEGLEVTVKPELEILW